MSKTSGKLEYADAKGMHVSTSDWRIHIGGPFTAFRLVGLNDRLLASLSDDGRLTVHAGYLWDGSSGPTVDGAADPVPSLVHDVLYEAMRARKLPLSMRQPADALYHELLRERGMGGFRAGLRYLGLRFFGRSSASPRKGAEYPKREAA